MSERFDKAYFDRYYERAKTRVHGPEKAAHLARAIVEMIAWFGGDLRTVLDVGAGAGFTRDWFAEHLPRVKYRSTDASAYACERYGHELRDIARYRAKKRFDLVLCQGVLPYLDDASAAAAIENLAAMTGGFLYFEAITARDLEQACDTEKTDGAVHLRTGAWYRKRFAPHFLQVGCGLYYARSGPLRFYELEAAP